MLPKTDPTGFALYAALKAEHGDVARARRAWSAQTREPCPFDYQPPWIVLDLETCSEVDLPEAGAPRYAEDPSTHVLVVGWCVGELPPESIVIGRNPAEPPVCPAPLAGYIAAGLPVIAHNAQFEDELWHRVLVARFGWPAIRPAQWRDTMAEACRLALPASLHGATAALGLAEQKDMGGKALMMRMCRPAAITKHLHDPWREHTADQLDRLAAYCRQDVAAERALWKATRALAPPPEVDARELDVWRATAALNRRGMQTDAAAVAACRSAVDAAAAAWGERVRAATGGALTGEDLNKVATLKGWFAHYGACEDLDKHTLARFLVHDDPTVQVVAQARAAVGLASLKKLDAMAARANADGRVRGMLVYHGASTGRWTAGGVQPQNLPRAEAADVEACLHDLAELDRDTCELLWGETCAAVQGCLRGLLTAAPGKVLLAADYAQIEARVVLWLAGDEHLELFRTGRDIYCEFASRVYGRPITKQDKKERQLGKVAVLGLGFGMGGAKFYDSCQLGGCPVAPDFADQVVQTYRETFARVKSYWYEVEGAAIEAVRSPGVPVIVRERCAFRMVGRHLFARLPSRRLLCFPFAQLGDRETPWGEMRPAVSFMGVNQLSKKWERLDTYGGRLVENLVQAAARDVMAEALLRAEAAGHLPVLTVHDEIVCETDPARADVRAFEQLCEQPPAWAPGLPVKAEGWSDRRYRK